MSNLSATETAKRLCARGYHVLPIIAGSKAVAVKNWTNLRIALPDIGQYFAPESDHGVGLLLGTDVGAGAHVAAVDVDINDSLLISRVMQAFSTSPPTKRGAKGVTLICRTDMPIKKRQFKRKDPVTQASTLVLEILAQGQQTVLPPSIHPNGRPYVWPGQPLYDVPPRDLPVLDRWVMNEIETAVLDPDSPMFRLNDMEYMGDGQGGTVHDSVLSAVASFVAREWEDDPIWVRVERATIHAVERSGRIYDWSGWEQTVRKMVADARAKGFADKKPRQKMSSVIARWIINEWKGNGCVYQRDGQLVVYHGGYWSIVPDAEIRHAVATQYHKNDASLDHQDYAQACATALDIAPRFPVGVPHPKICLMNGTYDLTTGHLGPWSAHDYLISRLPFSYDPKAVCPLYAAFMLRTFESETGGDRDKSIALYEEFLAHTLYECLDHQKFLIIKGLPGTGKSTLVKIARAMHSPSALSSVGVQDFGNERFRTAMVGKLLNVVTEVATVTHAADDFLKAVTSGDPVQVRYLYHEPIDVVLPTRIMVACNELFKTRDSSGAIERRMLILTCDNQVAPDDQDINLIDKLKGELPGIFNRIVGALKNLHERKRFLPPHQHALQVATFTEENNHTVQWVLERTHQGAHHQNPDYEIPAEPTSTEVSQLYLDFAEWSRLNGYKQMSSISFGMRLTTIGYKGSVKYIGKRAARTRPLTLVTEGKF